MQQLVVLQGPSQSGKTTTIKKVLYLLHEREPELEFRGKKWVECLEILRLKGVRIGISSRSDKFPDFRKNLDFILYEKKCDIGIVALNESMKGVPEVLEEFKNRDILIHKVQKYPIFCSRESKEQQHELNIKAANKVLNKFNEIFENLLDPKSEESHDHC